MAPVMIQTSFLDDPPPSEPQIVGDDAPVVGREEGAYSVFFDSMEDLEAARDDAITLVRRKHPGRVVKRTITSVQDGRYRLSIPYGRP